MARPIPVPDEVSKPYWDAVDKKRMVGQHCRNCNRYQHPPRRICNNCSSEDLDFRPLSGKGTIYAYTVMHDTRVAALTDQLPLPLVLVEMAEYPGLLVTTNLVGPKNDDIKIGAPVTVEFEQVAPGRFVPQFRLSK